MPNQPKTPLRSFRIPDDLYRAAQEAAKEQGRSLTDVVREALENFLGTAERDLGDDDEATSDVVI